MKTEFEKGKFVISLDFELFWGVRDKRTIADYGPNILGVKQAIPAILELLRTYDVKATFSTVGFLFAENKKELLQYIPSLLPEYTDKNLSPYEEIKGIGNDENEDPYHFGYSLLKKIVAEKMHEIGTHTFCHYYCLEPGQSSQAFLEDLKMAKKIAATKNIQVQSLVFPRNQFNEEYLSVCREAGISSYRGNPVSWLYAARNKNEESLFRRALRFLDTYINITGHHCHSKAYIQSASLVNVAASRFLRPYSSRLSFLESFRLRRIKRAMGYAAKKRRLFHLWWHPHNFGANLQENMAFLEQILRHYRDLHGQFGFESATMTGIAEEIKRHA